LRTTQSSYRHQIELAIARNDPVSVNHRVAALLASTFDIVFAATRTLHPGEKRLLDGISRLGEPVSDHVGELVRRVLHAEAGPAPRELLEAIDDLCDAVDSIARTTA